MNLKRIVIPALFLTVLAVGCGKDATTTTDTESGNWVRKSDLDGSTRTEAVSFVLNDLGYITTGYNGTRRLKDLWVYNADLNSWDQVADFMGEARQSAVAFTVNNKAYVGTGYNGTDFLKDFYEYDPAANTWTKKSDFAGTARYDAVGFGISSKGYVTTGFDGSFLKDIYSYDPTTDTWSDEISMGGSKRSGAVSFVYNNRAYIVSGTNNGTAVNDIWEFNPAATGNKWTEKRKISNISTETYDDDYNIARSQAVAFVIGDKAYISTGENGSYLNTSWVYDFATDLWSQKSPFEGVARSGSVAFTIKGRGFIATGRNSNSYNDDLYEFLPNETLNTTD